MSGLVVAEAKSFSVTFREHVPQVVDGMYPCAGALTLVPSLSIRFILIILPWGGDVIRKALTPGNDWIFLVLVMSPNAVGAKYW